MTTIDNLNNINQAILCQGYAATYSACARWEILSADDLQDALNLQRWAAEAYASARKLLGI